MSEKQKRILFLCAHRSVRELIAASLLEAYERDAWDIWIALAPFTSDEIDMVRQILDEVHVSLLSTFKIAEPSFDQSWDEGIVLCSGRKRSEAVIKCKVTTPPSLLLPSFSLFVPLLSCFYPLFVLQWLVLDISY